MSKKLVQVEVEAELADVVAAVTKCLADAKTASKSGVSGVALVTAISAALVADLAPVMAEVVQIPADLQESAEASLAAVLVSVPALIAAIKV